MLADVFGPPEEWPDHDLIGFSEFFDPEVTIAAYCSGAFPMQAFVGEPEDGMTWWSPVERGILPVERFRVSHSLRQARRRYTTSIDAAFDEVIRRCADPDREGGWITPEIIDVFTRLHQQGLVHSVETWDAQGHLVGGLYGVSIGGLFAGESMFHDPERGRDASKVALARLVDVLTARLSGPALLDVQWLTPHLASLGATEVPRQEYLQLLDRALEAPETVWPGPERIRHA